MDYRYTESGSTRGAAMGVVFPFVVVTLIWGSTWIVIKGQLGAVSPSWSVTYRFALAALVMFCVARWRREPLALDRHSLAFVALFGIAQFCFNFNFVYRAEQHVTSGLVALVFALLFIPNAVFSWIVFGQRVAGRFVVGSIIAVAGIALLIAQELAGAPLARGMLITGIGYTLAGVTCASIANVMQASETARKLSMTAMLAWGMLIGSVLDAGYSWTISGPPQWDWNWHYAAGLAYLGVMASAVAFTLYFHTIRAMGAARAAYSSVIIPVIAMAISTLVEDFYWTGIGMAGGSLALLGMAVALSQPRTPITAEIGNVP